MVALTSYLTNDNAWIIDSGASRHMIGESKQLHTLSKEPSSHAVEFFENKIYVVRGLGSTSLKLNIGSKLHLNNILYVPGLKSSLLSISCLEDKGERIVFVDGKVLVWGKYSSIEKAMIIGVREGSLIELSHHLLNLWFIWRSIPLSYGIEGMVIFIIRSSLLLVNWFMASPI